MTAEPLNLHHCESCGMPVQTRRYCPYCTDADGRLQSFEDKLADLIELRLSEHPWQTRQEAQQSTLDYMSLMPAWRDHPRITGHRLLQQR